ncbi:Ig-like domain-containing protein [Butyrivibrio sp. AE3004]|uniref:Ig-like domain-containing protein n=1 Tax=Butyrivibrio sp. AE3004 TaxID=1506994 RepID=UPI000494BCC5|nr:Ig-like domain-containing protein [Butyrivibrio sp. AE3004]
MGCKFKRILATMLAVTMAAMLCIIAIPAQAAVKKVTVKVTEDGGEKDISMSNGQKIQLVVKKGSKTLGKTKVTYKVSGKSVISVSKSGLITAKKGGDAEIEIKDKNSDYTATVSVEVNGGNSGSGKKVSVQKIWLNVPSITLEVGEGYTARVYIKETGTGGSVVWTSENADIATVDQNGNIRAVGHGSVRVHAQKGGKDACIMVNVN